MADISVTAASVVPPTGAAIRQGIAGAAITAGQPIVKSTTDGTLSPAKADTAPHAIVEGIAINNAATGQPVNYMQSGDLTYNAVLTQGGTFVLSSANAGGIAPDSDITAGGFKSILGVGVSTTVLRIGINNSGVAHS